MRVANMSRLSSPDELWAAFRSNPLLACASIQGIPAVRGHLHRSISASRPERVLILGFDGIPYSIMSRIATDFQELDLIPFLSTVPSTSATAWTSLLTGRKPADHGILWCRNLLALAVGQRVSVQANIGSRRC
jgi:hypothetical protein